MALTISRPRTLGSLTVTIKDYAQSRQLRDLGNEEVIQAVRHYFDMERHVSSPLACPLCRRLDKRPVPITTRPTSPSRVVPRLTTEDALRLAAERCVDAYRYAAKLPREPRARDWKVATEVWRIHSPEGMSADDGEGLPSLAAQTFREEFRRAVQLRRVKRGG